MSQKIGALWKREYEKDGKKHIFYSGEAEWPGVKVRVLVHKNDKKGNEKAPDLILYFDPYQPAQAPAAAAPGQDSTDAGEYADDIPF
jgi:hypothetical protein